MSNNDTSIKICITLSDDIFAKEHIVPFSFEFNGSWTVSHKCRQCNADVNFGADYLNNKISVSLVKGLNSKNYSLDFLQQLSTILHHTELYKVDDVWYLNRTDFLYEHDMQRMDSVTPAGYTCANCNAAYFGIVRIGIPAEPDKANPLGKPGKVEIEQLHYITPDEGKKLLDLLKWYNVQSE